MTTYPPVVAAIPNYNMGRHLRELIPQLLAQHYDAIFVLDDASTDDSVDVVAEFGDDVRFVRSPENRGAGANRNQIIDHVDSGTLIHFVDADMEMTTADTPAVAREIAGRYLRHGIGMIGGLVSRLDGSQEYCNYGAAFSLWGNFTSNVPRLVDHWRDKPRLAGAVQRVAARSPQAGLACWTSRSRDALIGCTKAICSSTLTCSRSSAATIPPCVRTRRRIWPSGWTPKALADNLIQASGSSTTTSTSAARTGGNGRAPRPGT